MSEATKENRLDLVYKWASVHTAEARSENILENYYWSDPVKRVLFKLKNATGTLIALVGLQGTGKSTALEVLSESLGDKKYLFWKWGKAFMERMREEYYFLENWERAVYQELSEQPDKFIQEKLRIAPISFRHMVNELRKPNQKDQALQQLCRIVSTERAEKLLDKRALEELKDALLSKQLERTKFILVDLPDYKKTDAYSFGKDLDYLQRLWDKLMKESGPKTTFLIVFQKELVMKRPHFFIGKMDIVELKPLKSDELVATYKLRWGTVEPFTENSLTLLADLSRGVFRRFLKYIQASIENFIINGKTPPIGASDVKAAISEDMLLTDMELELSDIFRKQTQKAQAVKILTTLQDRPLSQKEIATLINVSEATAGRLISQLETYKYVQRTRGEGKTWLISLASVD